MLKKLVIGKELKKGWPPKQLLVLWDIASEQTFEIKMVLVRNSHHNSK